MTNLDKFAESSVKPKITNCRAEVHLKAVFVDLCKEGDNNRI